MTRRAFSLVEITVAIFLIALVTALVVPRLGGSGRDGDAQARHALSSLADVQTLLYTSTGSFVSANDLTVRYADRLGTFTVTGDTSTTSTTVAVTSGGTATGAVVGLAARGSDACWLLLLSASSPPRWAVGTLPVCSAAAALAVTAPVTDPTLGLSPDKPIRL